MASPDFIDRLASMPALGEIPREELEWLVAHGRVELREPGVVMAIGEEVEDLFIILSGRIVVRVDRGVGPRRAIEWSAGDVSGALPFSRVGNVQNEVLAEAETEVLSIHKKHFPEMIHRCPGFTALTVHTMIDRVRRFNTSDLQDEKMLSLGRLAAGLAHELNNPSSATMRGAKLLRAGLSDAERASRALCGAGLSENQIVTLEEMCSDWLEPLESTPSLEREREIEDWLVSHQLGADHAGALADTAVTVDRLDELAGLVPEQALHAVIDWIIAASVTRVTAVDIERAASRIHDLVEAVKRFTAMDRVSGPEAVDVAAGLGDTVRIMAPKASAKGASLTLEAEPNVPPVKAVVGDLNHVWTNLIENAIDAVGDSGRIEVTAREELDHVVVRVIDDGPGIDPDVVSRVFDPFFTTKAPGEGMGLGLEIARQLLRRYGGEITVASEPGRTEFRVSLPVEAPGGR